MSSVKQDLLATAVENLRLAIVAEDNRRAEHVHHQANATSSYQSLRDAQEKRERAQAALEKLLGRKS